MAGTDRPRPGLLKLAGWPALLAGVEVFLALRADPPPLARASPRLLPGRVYVPQIPPVTPALRIQRSPMAHNSFSLPHARTSATQNSVYTTGGFGGSLRCRPLRIQSAAKMQKTLK